MSLILQQDSYKYSQYKQFPAGTEYVYSYVESRGGIWKDTLFFGLQAFIQEYLTKPITQADIDEADELITAHGEPFNREGWEYILNQYGGKLPIRIRAPKEGLIIPTKNVLVTIENTDPKCFWLTNFLETAILRGVWYPTTVATNSYESRKIIKEFLERTGDPDKIDFYLNDFGSRGVSSVESSGLGGMAHLATGFKGTDNVIALQYAKKYYGAEMAGFSIPASEHTITSSYGKEREHDYVNMMLDTYGTGGKMFAMVADTYDVYKFCELLGTDPVIKSKITANSLAGGMTVVRPDSGEPSEVVTKCLYILEKHFGSTKNAKGFRVLNDIRVIQGDGIDHASIQSILFVMELAGFSADNIVLGQGGKLLQSIDRDTMRWALKCSAVCVNGEWRNVWKDPITDSGKRSKRGRITLWTNNCGEYTSSINKPIHWSDKGIAGWSDAMETYFEDGEVKFTQTFDQVRANSVK